MPIKTILVHLSNDERHSARLEVAVALAQKFHAFLDILYIATPVTMPAAMTGRGASFAFIAEATAIAHEKADQIEEEVRQACRNVSYSWTIEEGDHLELLAARALYADLAIVTQSHPAHLEDLVRLHIPDQLPMQATCPTLVLPWEGWTERPGRSMLIAWKGTRESSRSVRNALPLLQAAERVTILTIDAPDHTADSSRELSVFLARHGIATDHQSNIHDGNDIGEIILNTGHDLGCDSIVMGAYGHSRLRELVLGGTTRYVLGHMQVPVIMSH